MKKFFSFLIAIALAAVLFGGCDLFGKRTAGKNEPADKAEKQQQVRENGATNADTLLDDQIYKEAITAGDKTQCEKISDQSKQAECKNVIEANGITKSAVEKNDSSACSDITLDRYRENCVDKVARKDAALKQWEEIQATQNKAIGQKDISVCNEIKEEAHKYSCQFSVMLNLATEKKDPNLCDKIESTELAEKCKIMVSSVP